MHAGLGELNDLREALSAGGWTLSKSSNPCGLLQAVKFWQEKCKVYVCLWHKV